MYTLPKIWVGRIQKYWDKFMPTDFPKSSSEFSLKFSSAEAKDAVVEFESKLGTEESTVLDFLPENTFVTSYIGTYDVTGTPDELTLLSPEKVTSDNVIALHYVEDTDTWEKVEDISVVDGYVWGTLESFSPIAIVQYAKEIHLENSVSVVKNLPCVVCEGNPVQVKVNDNNDIVVVNPSTGKEIEITATNTMVVGGSIDGTPIKSTSIAVTGVPSSTKFRGIISGSVYYNAEDPTASTTVDSINVSIKDSNIVLLTGSSGAVRTKKLTYNIENATFRSHLASGESIAVNGKDVNKANPTFASPAWLKECVMNIKNAKTYVFYGSGNTGYFYVDSVNLNIDGFTTYSSHDYFCVAGSNGYTRDVNASITNSKLRHISNTNRGGVGSVNLKVSNSSVDEFYIGGDNSEGDVDGTIDNVKINVNAGDGVYNFKLGVNGKENISADNVDSVKVSRNAGVVNVDDEVLTALGDKYIIK